MKVLWLVSWFPSKIDFLNGDFIERHAIAVSKKVAVVVLYAVKDADMAAGKSEIVTEHKENLTILRAYYGAHKGISFVRELSSLVYYIKMMLAMYKMALKAQGAFDLIHVHIPMRAGLVALWLNWRKGTKYIITEQSSWFMPPYRLYFKEPLIKRIFTKRIYKKASAVHVVSGSLGKELTSLGMIDTPYTVIPNVVNTTAFYPDYNRAVNNDEIHYVTVIGNIYHKNTDGTMRAFAAYLTQGYKAILHVVGPNDDILKELAMQLGITDNVVFYGAVANDTVADINRQCDAMLFFTRYETFGCVMAEALCCGLPVIASRIDVLKENLTEGVNAVFVNPEDEDDLVKKLIYFHHHYTGFNKKEIALNATQKYSYEHVATAFEDWYKKVLAVH